MTWKFQKKERHQKGKLFWLSPVDDLGCFSQKNHTKKEESIFWSVICHFNKVHKRKMFVQTYFVKLAFCDSVLMSCNKCLLISQISFYNRDKSGDVLFSPIPSQRKILLIFLKSTLPFYLYSFYPCVSHFRVICYPQTFKVQLIPSWLFLSFAKNPILSWPSEGVTVWSSSSSICRGKPEMINAGFTRLFLCVHCMNQTTSHYFFFSFVFLLHPPFSHIFSLSVF